MNGGPLGKRSLLALVLAAVTACMEDVASVREDGIVGGRDDDTGPIADAVAFSSVPGVGGCTVTLVSPDTVISASHCGDPLYREFGR